MFRTLTKRQRVTDLIVAAAFFALFAPLDFVLALGAYDLGAAILAVAALTLFAVALALRRWSPALALAAAWLAAVVQMVGLGNVQLGNLAILAVLYAVAGYGSRPVRWLGLASAVLGALLAALYLLLLLPLARAETVGIGPGNFIVTALASLAVLALPWTFGMLASARRLSRQIKEAQIQAQHEAERAEYAVVVEQERNKIARDMHDVVAHSLAVVIAQADGARYAATAQPQLAADALGTIAATAREALADVRLLLAELRHSEAEGPQPTVHDLERLIEQLRATGLPVTISSEGEPAPMSAGHQIAVYRIVQEALTNVLRHGDPAQPVLLELRWDNSGVRITVTSRLRAGATSTAQPARGHGIAGMRERAVLAGGSFSAGRSGGTHFEVAASIPLGTGVARAPIQQTPSGAQP